MGDSELNDVKESFGKYFQQYCQRNKIVPVKNNYGAFQVSDFSTLKACVDAVDTHTEKLNEYLEGIQNSRIINRFPKQRYARKKNKSKKKHCPRQKRPIFTNPFLANVNLEIRLHKTSAVIPSYPVCKAPSDYILNTAKNGGEMFEFILKETRERIDITEYKNSIISISALLEEFQRKHKRFHYYSVLKHITEKEEVKEKLKWQYEVTQKQLKAFFELVFSKVVPKSLFGKPKNIKKIKKALFSLLNSPSFINFNLTPFIGNIDISSILWLQSVENQRTQWLIFTKLVKWFFNGFLIKVLRSQLHITMSPNSYNERLYIRRSDWCYVQKQFIKKKLCSDVFQPNVELKDWNPPIGEYKLIPKSSTVRPIFLTKCNEREKNDTTLLLKFLKQLYITNYQTTNFYEEWKSAIEKKRKSVTGKFCLISSDVVDAFGSIRQGHMYSIIHSLCQNLPETLTLRFYGLKTKRRIRYDTLCYKEYFADKNLDLPITRGTLYTRADYMGCKLVRRNWILGKIYKYIFSQRVKVKNKIYLVGKGLVQGTTLSPILSDIYYNSILQNEAAVFFKSGTLIRYMDDILFATESQATAKLFFQLIRKGFPRYNCRFKESKTQSNVDFDGNKTVKSINYIGFKINCNSFEVVPEMSKMNIRYLVSLQSKASTTPLQLLKNKLSSQTFLKLSKVVLDNKINSTATIINIIRGASLMQAKRAGMLILELFPDISRDASTISKIIRNSNLKLSKFVMRVFVQCFPEMSKVRLYWWNRRILRILWKSYRDVFQKKPILRENFRSICR